MVEVIFRCVMILLLTSCVLAQHVRAAEASSGESLQARLSKIEARRIGAKGEMETLEKDALKLLKEFKSPKEKALIYATIATMFASSADKDEKKIQQYCQKALKFPQELATSLRLHVFLAGSLQRDAMALKDNKKRKDEFLKVREDAMNTCLIGLKLVIEKQKVKTRQPPPAVGKYDFTGSPRDPENAKLIQQHEKEMKARMEIVFQNKLIDYREIFVRKVASLYALSLYDMKKLKSQVYANLPKGKNKGKTDVVYADILVAIRKG